MSSEQLSGSPYESVSGNKLAYFPPPAVDQRDTSSDVTVSLEDSASKYMAISTESLKRSVVPLPCYLIGWWGL